MSFADFILLLLAGGFGLALLLILAVPRAHRGKALLLWLAAPFALFFALVAWEQRSRPGVYSDDTREGAFGFFLFLGVPLWLVGGVATVIAALLFRALFGRRRASAATPEAPAGPLNTLEQEAAARCSRRRSSCSAG